MMKTKGEMTPVMEATLETFNPCEKAGRQELLELSLIQVKLLCSYHLKCGLNITHITHAGCLLQVACMPQNFLVFLPPNESNKTKMAKC